MSDDPNPFARPDSAANPYSTTYATQPSGLGGGGSRGMVGQVNVLGILMIVQGVLIGLMGLFFAFYAVFMPFIMNAAREDALKNAANNGGNVAPMPPEMGMWIGIGLGVAAMVILIIAVLTIMAGVKVLKFKSRGFALTMLGVGMLTCLTCYCMPTQIALSIYGMIMLLNAPVIDAFKMGEQGRTAREIQQHFLSQPY